MVRPAPVSVIVEFVGELKVFDIDTFPDTPMEFATVFVTVPELVKFPATVQDAPAAVPKVTDPVLFTAPVDAVPPAKVMDPAFVTAPEFIEPAPVKVTVPPAPVFTAEAPAAMDPVDTVTVPVVTVSPVTVRVCAPTCTCEPAPLKVRPPDKVAAPIRTRMSLAPFRVCRTFVENPLIRRVRLFRSISLPESVVVPGDERVTLAVEERTRKVPPVLLIVVPFAMANWTVAPTAVELRLKVAEFVRFPLTVRLVAVPPPKVKVPPVTDRLAKVAVPSNVVVPAPVFCTAPKVWEFGVIAWAPPPFRTRVDPAALVRVPRIMFPPTVKVPPPPRSSDPPVTSTDPLTLTLFATVFNVPETTMLLVRSAVEADFVPVTLIAPRSWVPPVESVRLPINPDRVSV